MKRYASASESETLRIAAEIAAELFSSSGFLFLELKGSLGAGKSAFARGFIPAWLKLAKENTPENIVSPTYNLVKMYGVKHKIAHYDLYRIKSLKELEAIDFASASSTANVCLVEWFDLSEEFEVLRPAKSVQVSIEFDEGNENARRITIQEVQSDS